MTKVFEPSYTQTARDKATEQRDHINSIMLKRQVARRYAGTLQRDIKSFPTMRADSCSSASSLSASPNHRITASPHHRIAASPRHRVSASPNMPSDAHLKLPPVNARPVRRFGPSPLSPKHPTTHLGQLHSEDHLTHIMNAFRVPVTSRLSRTTGIRSRTFARITIAMALAHQKLSRFVASSL